MVRWVLSLFILLVGVCSGLSDTGSCELTQWSSWSACTPKGRCPDALPPEKTNEIPYGGGKGRSKESRDKMAESMRVKDKLMYEITRCRANGTCPEKGLTADVSQEKCGSNGRTAKGFECRYIDQLAYMSFKSLMHPLYGSVNAIKANDIWGWTDPITKEEWALVGLSVGTTCVSLKNPKKPKAMAHIPSRTFPSSWRDIKVVNNTMYIISEASGHGLQTFDLEKLRDLTEYKVMYYPDVGQMKKFGSAHNVVANEERNYIYVVGARAEANRQHDHCNGGLHIIDVSDPKNPKFKSCFSSDGYTHDAHCMVYRGPHVEYKEHAVCFCFNEDSLTIVDVDDPQKPTLISRTGYNGFAYTHQGWLTEDHELLLMDDELDEIRTKPDKHTRTLIWDVRRLDSPKQTDTFCSENKAIDHNQYIKDWYSYQSDYEAGLRILYVNKTAGGRMTELAYFDVHPGADRTAFAGTWSNYPYYKSGVVVVSSIEKGLFVLKPNMAAIRKAKEDGKKKPGIKRRTRKVISGNDCSSYPLEESMDC